VPAYRADPRDENAARTAQVSAWLASLYITDAKALTIGDRVRIDAVIANRPDFATMSDRQLLDYFRSLIPLARRLLKRHVVNTYGSNVLTGVIAQIFQAAGASSTPGQRPSSLA
jgi:rifampicin phosphotransferase